MALTYPIIAELCHAPELSFGQVAPTLGPVNLEEAEYTIGAAVEISHSDKEGLRLRARQPSAPGT